MVRFTITVIAFLCIAPCTGKPLNIPGSSKVATLPTQLLNEVVKHSSKYDAINYVYGETGDASFARTQEDVNQGVLDIMWTATSQYYEESFSAIYFPIYKGSLGVRIAIIKQQNSALFATINTRQQLTNLVACQGKLWADTNILQANGVTVAASHKYLNLFPMLEGGRCDYFPRAFFEPWGELQRESKYLLTVDEHVLLRYPLANFFFVKKGNQELAEHITQILLAMHKDGRFEQIFRADADVKRGLEHAKLAKRRVFEFENPYMTQRMRQIPAEFWLNFESE